MKSCHRAARLLAALVLLPLVASATDHDVTIDPVDFDRWMYPFNGTPGSRNLASTFGAIGATTLFDNKDAFFIVAVDTAAAGIPTGEGPSNYNGLSVRLTATHFVGVFDYDPTYDSYTTYLDPGDPSYVADSDAGRPIELYGVGLREGYLLPLAVGAAPSPGPVDFEESERFCEGCGFPFDGQAIRNIFPYDPSVPDAEGDVSNNVERFAPLTGGSFETTPWAIGLSTSGLAPGDPVPEGSNGVAAGETFEFQLDVANPVVRQYVQEGLDEGVLAFAIVSMHDAEEQQGGMNPNFYTADSADSAAIPPTMEIAVTVPEPAVATGLLAGGLALAGLARRRGVAG